MVALLGIFFSKTIDKAPREISKSDGNKPILTDSNPDILMKFLFGKQVFSNIEFGCNQAILVRTNEERENLPEILKHFICLTIFESKVKKTFKKLIMIGFGI